MLPHADGDPVAGNPKLMVSRPGVDSCEASSSPTTRARSTCGACSSTRIPGPRARLGGDTVDDGRESSGARIRAERALPDPRRCRDAGSPCCVRRRVAA